MPLLSRPGPNFASELLSLADVPKLLAMWPFRIQKNHGTVVVHEPASGFLASPKWARGDAVPPEMLREVLDGGRTFVVHNLEVYWPPITQFARQLTRFFHSYVQVNLYHIRPLSRSRAHFGKSTHFGPGRSVGRSVSVWLHF